MLFFDFIKLIDFGWISSLAFRYLPSEQSALERFLEELEHAPVPSASSFVDTYGIVMSGGAPHVLQALANLDVLRSYHKSDLPPVCLMGKKRNEENSKWK